MKLTLHIDDNIAPALIQALASLLARDTEPVADTCPGHPELPLMPVSELPTPERMPVSEWAAKWIAAGGDVPPTPAQLAALAAPTRTDDEDPAIADVRWQATPEPEPLPPGTTFEGRDRFESEPTPGPDPWDVPTSTDAEPAGFAAGTNGKLEVVALDETNPDPTQRVLNWPQELLSIPLPEKPEGKTKWVYRGTFEGYALDATGREVYYCDEVDDRWVQTSRFSTFFHHIEAI